MSGTMDDKNDSPKFPKGWVWTRLENITDIILGQSPPSSTYNLDKTGLPFYQGKAEFGGIYPAPVKWCLKPKKVAEKGDVLISVRAPVGPTNICPEKSCIGRGLAAIRPLGNMHSLFILYLIRSYENKLIGKKTGTTFDAITGDQLKKFEIPLPPLPEQHRIAAKIEELFTKLDAGVVALKKVKAQLKRYRQAVLKYAFEGKLTEEWREAHKVELESASVLLEKLNEERKKKAKGKYKELPPLDTSDLPVLPEGWEWARLGEVIGKVPLTGKKLRQREYQEKGKFPVIDQGQSFIGGYTDKEDLKVCCKPPVIIFGDHTKIVKYIDFDFVAGADGIKVIKPKEVFYMKLFFYFVQAIELPDKGYARHFHFLEKSLIPLPPFPEQHKIVEEIEHRLSVADEVEKVIEQSLKQAERLRQSILKKAFEGKLVPQDPNDEPAEKLLEKIKTEKAKREVEKEWGGNPKSKGYTKQMRFI